MFNAQIARNHMQHCTHAAINRGYAEQCPGCGRPIYIDRVDAKTDESWQGQFYCAACGIAWRMSGKLSSAKLDETKPVCPDCHTAAEMCKQERKDGRIISWVCWECGTKVKIAGGRAQVTRHRRAAKGGA